MLLFLFNRDDHNLPPLKTSHNTMTWITLSNHFVNFHNNVIIVALGANLEGPWGPPKRTFLRALDELTASRIKILNISRIYHTEAYGRRSQPVFSNATISISTSMPATALLQELKRIEARGGREKTKARAQSFMQWKPRALDLDIVTYKGVVRNWKMHRPIVSRQLILPHPGAHERAFVLRPVCDIAPEWHHPVFGLTAAQLLNRPQTRNVGAIIGDDDL